MTNSLLAKDHVNDWLQESLVNFRVQVHHGITIKPKWYDFPRHFGWRAKKRDTFLRGCEVVVDRPNHIIYCTPAMEGRLRASLPDVRGPTGPELST